jgi:hypothetical protein
MKNFYNDHRTMILLCLAVFLIGMNIKLDGFFWFITSFMAFLWSAKFAIAGLLLICYVIMTTEPQWRR